jgi:uncharacterized membrane protein
MFNEIKKFLIIGTLLVLVDFIYLKSMSNYYKKLVFKIQGTEMVFNLYYTILCYLILVFGLQYLIINKEGSILDAAILGWVIYGVFEATNGVIFKNWELWPSVIIDTLWGGILFAIITFIYNKLNIV